MQVLSFGEALELDGIHPVIRVGNIGKEFPSKSKTGGFRVDIRFTLCKKRRRQQHRSCKEYDSFHIAKIHKKTKRYNALRP